MGPLDGGSRFEGLSRRWVRVDFFDQVSRFRIRLGGGSELL